jgi:hypothetical protein
LKIQEIAWLSTPRLGHEKWWTFQPKHSEKSWLYVDEAGANFDIPTFFD